MLIMGRLRTCGDRVYRKPLSPPLTFAMNIKTALKLKAYLFKKTFKRYQKDWKGLLDAEEAGEASQDP